MDHSARSQQRSDHNLRKRSLAELDDVIDEIIARNPEFVSELLRFVADKQKADQSK
jgi:hypothetical protein